MNNIKAVKFLSALDKDNLGRSVWDFCAFSEEYMEDCHDWVQWAFPIDTPSRVNPFAPVIDENVTYHLSNDSCALIFHGKLVSKYLASIGIDGYLRDDGSMCYDVDYDKFFRVVRGKDSHHMLRISRLLRNLYLFGLEQQAIDLRECLFDIAEKHPYNFSTYTITQWFKSTK